MTNSEQQSEPKDVEQVILVGEKVNMRTLKKQLKDKGYNVTDTLSKLRAIIVKFTPEQLSNIRDLGDILYDEETRQERPPMAFVRKPAKHMD